MKKYNLFLIEHINWKDSKRTMIPLRKSLENIINYLKEND
jgi:hypothetical protein